MRTSQLRFRGQDARAARSGANQQKPERLIDLPTWIAGLRQVQRAAVLPGHSWPFYRDEQHVWL
jgi:hypothetical protein